MTKDRKERKVLKQNWILVKRKEATLCVTSFKAAAYSNCCLFQETHTHTQLFLEVAYIQDVLESYGSCSLVAVQPKVDNVTYYIITP